MVAVTEDLTVRLVRTGDGDLVAIEPSCPHLGSPLTTAVVDGVTLECPFHWYAFDLADGANLHPGWDDCRLTVYPTRIDGGEVQILLPGGG